MPDTTDTTFANVGQRTPRSMSTLVRRALEALDLWIAEESASDSVDHYDALLPSERVGDLDEERAFVTALALSPRCLVCQQVPQVAAAFVSDYDAAHPERGLAVRFESRADSEVLKVDQVRAEMRKTLQLLWPEFEGWDAPPILSHQIKDYRYDVASDRYWYLPLRVPRSARAINADIDRADHPRVVIPGDPPAVIRVDPSEWVADRGKGLVIEGAAWMPGQPWMVRNVIVTDTGRSYQPGALLFNTWKRGPKVQSDAPSPTQWLYLIENLIPNRVHREELLNRFAFVVQKPGQIIPGFTALFGPQGVGKDALVLPLNYALGWHNVKNIAPNNLLDRFNGFLRAQLNIINEFRAEGREGGEKKYYDAIKIIYMTPPETVPIEDKFAHMVHHLKSASCIITSNEIAGFTIPEDDRRGFFPEIKVKPRWHIDVGKPEFFVEYFRWLRHERGYAAVHRYLAERDISKYDPTKQPPMTRVKRQAQDITSAGDNAISRAIAKLGTPEVFFEIELHDLARRGTHNVGAGPDQDLLVALRYKTRVQMVLEAGYQRFPLPRGVSKWTTTVRKGAGLRWEKKSKAAYVLREIWDSHDDPEKEALVFRHLNHRLRRLALEDPRLLGGMAENEDWSDPATGHLLTPLPPLLEDREDEANVEEAPQDAREAAQEADALEAKGRRDLARAAEVRQRAGLLDLRGGGDAEGPESEL